MKLIGWLAGIIALGALGAGTGALAKGWPTPAAGESASGGPEIVFTFDDGPNPKTTPLVLDLLASRHIHAVFFLVGEMAGNRNPKVPALIQRILRDGHVIATHTMTHKDLCRVSEPAAVRDLDDGKATVEQVAGVPTAWFRTPYGARCERVERLLAERHLAHFHWDIDPQEWKNKNGDVTAAYIIKRIQHLQDRAVLLMHDTKAATVVALPQVLDWIEAENARRTANGRMPIRILSGADLAVERTAPGLTAWLREAAASSVDDGLALVASALP